MTTSAFTSGAPEYAQSISTRIILIDGRRLAELMIRYGVAVRTRQPSPSLRSTRTTSNDPPEGALAATVNASKCLQAIGRARSWRRVVRVLGPRGRTPKPG
ncbi:restriction endonuclease [Nocardia vermiculata]|uniref:restriction endonuclease n=1 Tax=Nocardia vermiculata TaxID=257274 RepID=UPI001FE1E6E8|nr:restriction endonuclease [Nocardia vermiculata]